MHTHAERDVGHRAVLNVSPLIWLGEKATLLSNQVKQYEYMI